jgi:hypothetical protein
VSEYEVWVKSEFAPDNGQWFRVNHESRPFPSSEAAREFIAKHLPDSETEVRPRRSFLEDES